MPFQNFIHTYIQVESEFLTTKVIQPTDAPTHLTNTRMKPTNTNGMAQVKTTTQFTSMDTVYQQLQLKRSITSKTKK